ncbi:uncharacterized protein LOC121731879 [Aricia agestis]|uniref:uncharacterized protein LOC121731879 n=1 Tax=Aricia agestis TaxID=91739 RepID=UPI001C20ACB5|nr:uncharacterized protein LOC121731879 [Aricia agestis]
MNREFLFDYGTDRPPERWSFSDSLSRWTWSIICCGIPGVPCSYCDCCMKNHEEEPPIINIARVYDTEPLPIPTCERELPHRPHALRGRKSTPELMSAVKCALTQLQGQPHPDEEAPKKEAPEKGAPEKDAPEQEDHVKEVFRKEA